MNGWISVKERLPSTDNHVLVYTVSGFMRVAHLHKRNKWLYNGTTEVLQKYEGLPDRWICDRGELEDEVVYWKPLSELPEIELPELKKAEVER